MLINVIAILLLISLLLYTQTLYSCMSQPSLCDNVYKHSQYIALCLGLSTVAMSNNTSTHWLSLYGALPLHSYHCNNHHNNCWSNQARHSNGLFKFQYNTVNHKLRLVEFFETMKKTIFNKDGIFYKNLKKVSVTNNYNDITTLLNFTEYLLWTMSWYLCK